MGSLRRIRDLRPAAIVVALLGLAACSAGVPQTGEVVSISPVTTTTPPDDAEALQDLTGPSSGQSASDVAVGYMNAMNTGDVSRIQKWVMPDARDRVAGWSRPTTTVRVYSVFEPGPPSVRDGRRIVPIKVKLVGQLRGGRDWYPATGDDVISLELGSDGADARVANPDGLWMRDVSFSRRYTPAEVFLAPDLSDPSPQLAPVPVFVPRGAEGDPEGPEESVKSAIELLLAGPRGRYGNLDTAIPRGTTLKGFRYANGVATVNLSRGFARAGDGSGLLRVGQVVWTVNRLLPSAAVRMLVEGRPIRSVGSDQFPVLRHWGRRDVPLASMWPQRSLERQDEAILFVRRGEIYTVAPEAGQSPRPVELNAPSPKSAPTWSPDRRWMAFLAGSGARQALWVVQPGGKADPAEELSGRLSPPSWSPDSKRIYLVRRDEAGARLLEVTRSTLSVRSLAFPPLPSGLQPASVAVSPDGAFVLAVADRPDRKIENAEQVPGGQLFLGQLGPDGVVSWSERQIAPGLGRVFSPVWVDPVTVAFIAETTNKDDLGKLWILKSDGWDPTAVLNDSEVAIGDIGNHLTVDPAGRSFVVTARTSNGASLWMISRQEKAVSYLTFPAPNAFDTDPSFASR